MSMGSDAEDQPLAPCDPPEMSLLEFDMIPTQVTFILEAMRTRIVHLVENMDRESTLATVIRVLEAGYQQRDQEKSVQTSGITTTTTTTTARTTTTTTISSSSTVVTPGNVGYFGGDIMISSMSSMNANISFNGAAHHFANEATYHSLPATTTSFNDIMGDANCPLFSNEDGDEIGNSTHTDQRRLPSGEETLKVDGVARDYDIHVPEFAEDGVLPFLTSQPIPEINEIVTPLVALTGYVGQIPTRMYRRRAAVSAESVPLDIIETYTPPVVEKTFEEEQVVRVGVMACHLFSTMERRDQATIVRALQREAYAAGTDILKQGCASLEKLFLITQGTCEVIKNGRVVHTLHIGSTFGEMEMIYHLTMCVATVRCVTNCTLYTLDQHTYQNIVLAVSLHKRKKYEQLLCNVGLFKTLSDYDRMLIAEALVTKTYRKNDYIVRRGEDSKWMHIIVEGEVKVVGRRHDQMCEILRLREGHVVGELEFLFNHLTVADVVAVSRRVTTAQIQRNHLELIVGSIQDHLKEYVVSSGIYTHYLGEANERIKTELDLLGKRTKRMAGEGERENTLLDRVDVRGEIILPAPKDKVMVMEKCGNMSADRRATVTVKDTTITPGTSVVAPTSTHVLFRFPLAPLHENFLTMIGLREDGCIIVWNEMMVQLTGYTAEEAVGQHIYSFLLEPRDQTAMHTAISEARRYTGDVEAFFEAKRSGRSALYTFARIDGLTKVHFKLSIVPSIVSHGRDAAEIMLAIGEEQRVFPQEMMDKSQLLVDQVSGVLRDGDSTYEDRLHRIASVLASFDSTCRAIHASTEDVRVVNIRQMIGQVIMDYGAQCVVNGVAVCQRFEGLYADNVYVNAKSFPECLRYAMSNCTHHLRDAQVTITITITETNGLEFLVIVFHDNGPGFPHDLLTDFHHGRHSGKYPHLHRVRGAMEKQGGALSIESVPGDTSVTFTLPFVPAREKAENGTEHRPDALETSKSFNGIMGPMACSNGSSSSSSGSTGIGAMSLGNGTMCDVRPPLGKQTFTTLVVEDTAAHRNMLCTFLWDRKHAVLPAYNIEDIEQLIDVADILFIDPHQSIFEHSKRSGTTHVSKSGNNNETSIDPIALLREKARRMVVVITGSEMDEFTCKAYHTAGFLTLKKPCTSIRALQCICKAEGMISQYKLEAERIQQTRATLSKNCRGAWKRGKLLGKGSFGAVYEATEVLTGGKVAVKEIWLGKQSTQIENFVDEISTMCDLQHPNIIHYFYCEENTEENVIRVFMEYASGGTLQQLLQKKGRLGFKEYQSLLRDIVQGVAYIHSMHYVHGDLKTANVLLSVEGIGKIGDFGTARTVAEGELLYQMQGSLLYMSPECMGASDTDENGITIGYSFPSDIWSLGCIALEMATNRPPFSHLPSVKGPMGITRYVTSLHDTPDLSPLFDGPPGIIEFVSLCLNPDPTRRPTAAQLLHMSLFSEAADEDTKSALQVLQRLQSLHELNNFVAFQETEKVQRPRVDTRRRFVHRRESDFFDSSQDDEEEEEAEEQEQAEKTELIEDNSMKQPTENPSYDNNSTKPMEYSSRNDVRRTTTIVTCETCSPTDKSEEVGEVRVEEMMCLGDSTDGPSPRHRSHTKSRSQTRSYPRVDEDAFFASSSSSSSSVISLVHGDADNTTVSPSTLKRETMMGGNSAPMGRKSPRVLLPVETQDGATTQEFLGIDMPSAAFMNHCTAPMGISINAWDAFSNQESAKQMSVEQQPQEEGEEGEGEHSHRHEPYLSSRHGVHSSPGHSITQSEALSSPSTKTTSLRHPKRGVKNMFSVEEYKATGRETSPEAQLPYTRIPRHLPHSSISNSNKNSSNNNNNNNSSGSSNSNNNSKIRGGSSSGSRSVSGSNNTNATTDSIGKIKKNPSGNHHNSSHYQNDNGRSSSSGRHHLHSCHSYHCRFGVAPQPLAFLSPSRGAGEDSPLRPSSHESVHATPSPDGINAAQKQKAAGPYSISVGSELDEVNRTVARLWKLLGGGANMSSTGISMNRGVSDQQEQELQPREKGMHNDDDDNMMLARDILLGLETRIECLKAHFSVT